MTLSIIAAVNNKNVIGCNGKMPWSVPEDLKVFQKRTVGHPIIMGRKTFDSIGALLKGRANIVVSKNYLELKKKYKNLVFDGYSKPQLCFTKDFLQAFSLANLCNSLFYKKDEIFVIGGGEIYKQALQYADSIYLSRINDDSDGDTFFPTIDSSWKMCDQEIHKTFKVEVYRSQNHFAKHVSEC